jgi:ligand-binding sensor domain-containing protein
MIQLLAAMVFLAEHPSPDGELRLSQYMLRSWTTLDGLPQNSVQSIFQDALGYLWLGTQEGLVRFDGLNLQPLSEDWGLPSSYIYQAQQDEQGGFWVATRNGLLHRRDQQSAIWDESRGLPSQRIFAFARESDGSIWAATGLGLLLLKNESVTVYGRAEGLPHQAIRALMLDSSNRLWVGTTQGLALRRPDGWQIFTTNEGLASNRIGALAQGADGTIWVGTDHAVSALREDGIHTFPLGIPADSLILSLLSDAKGALWVGSSVGLFRLRFPGGQPAGKAAGEPYGKPTMERTLAGQVIRSLYLDGEESLWVGTASAGLIQLRQGKVKVVGQAEGLGSDNVWALAQDAQGNIMLAHDGGVSRWDGLTAEEYQLSGGPQAFRSLHVDGGDRLWAGSRGSGLFRAEPGSLILEEFSAPEGMVANIRTFASDDEGRLWAGSMGMGLIALDGSFAQVSFPTYGWNFIYSMVSDGEKGFWLGTDGSGLLHYTPRGTQVFTRKEGLPGDLVTSVCRDEAGRLWVACDQGGVALFSNGRFHVYGRKEGLPHHSVFHLVPDRMGNLWMSSNVGILRLPLQELVASMGGRGIEVAVEVFGNQSGLRSQECNFSGGSSGLLGQQGEIWFPTIAGAVTIHPGAIPINSSIPRTVLERVTIDGVSFEPSAAPALLPPGTERLEFSFTSLSLAHGRQNRFRCRLKGLTDQWHEASTRTVTYTTLPPGEYRFEVMGSNNDSVWSSQAPGYSFRVAPFFYQAWWFRVALLLLAGAVAALVVRLRTNAFQARETALNALVEERTRELEEANQTLTQVQNSLVHAARDVGKSEVSVDILHNVGNALNSLNVGSHLIQEQVEELLPPLFQRISRRLDEHKGGLAAFVQSEEGSRYLEGMAGLVGYVESRQKALRQEVEDLQESIQHLNEIVLAQQEQVRGTRLRENVDLGSLIETALKICRPLQVKSGIEVACAIAPLAPLASESSKLLQVLVNLLKNASESLAEAKPPSPTITIVLSEREGEVRLAVMDNGGGFPPDLASQLFRPGFSSKGKGRGLGLHFCALAARELGGRLVAESAGVGMGASFVLFLPNENSHS